MKPPKLRVFLDLLAFDAYKIRQQWHPRKCHYRLFGECQCGGCGPGRAGALRATEAGRTDPPGLRSLRVAPRHPGVHPGPGQAAVHDVAAEFERFGGGFDVADINGPMNFTALGFFDGAT